MRCFIFATFTSGIGSRWERYKREQKIVEKTPSYGTFKVLTSYEPNIILFNIGFLAGKKYSVGDNDDIRANMFKRFCMEQSQSLEYCDYIFDMESFVIDGTIPEAEFIQLVDDCSKTLKFIHNDDKFTANYGMVGDIKTVVTEIPNLDKTWYPNINLSALSNIMKNVEEMRAKSKIYPPTELVMNAFQVPFNDVNVVILGQDPYHGEGQAMGLSFSVPDGVKVPPSLHRIYSAIKKCYPDYIIPESGNLSKWVKQGVLLLNSALTVEEGKPNSHQELWNTFTDDIISRISENKSHVIFVLWGNFAKQKKTLIKSKHTVLDFAHPSPLSRVDFSLCTHFKDINNILKMSGKNEIIW